MIRGNLFLDSWIASLVTLTRNDEVVAWIYLSNNGIVRNLDLQMWEIR